jgi:hypothetical protein
MATVVGSVTDCRSFWREIVVPDYNDFGAAIDDLQHAFDCATSLFHPSDWLCVEHKAHIDANFTYRDKNGAVQRVTDEKTFANALGQLHPDFDLIHGIANSAKHLALKILDHILAHRATPRTRAYKAPAMEKRLWCWPYGGAPRVMLEDPGRQEREFSDLANST